METRMHRADPTAPTTPEQYRAALERQERVISSLRDRLEAAEYHKVGGQVIAEVVSGYSGDPDTRGSLDIKKRDLSGCKVGDKLYCSPVAPESLADSDHLAICLENALSRWKPKSNGDRAAYNSCAVALRDYRSGGQ